MDVREWPEAEVIGEPVRERLLGEPRLLVRRRTHLIIGPRDNDLISLPGQPVISLFTGAGGFDLGIEMAGFCCLVQHERDDAACETLISHRPNCFRHAALIQGDICQTPTTMLLSAANLRVGEAGLLIGGPPCQGFSTSNSKRKKNEADRKAGGKGDERNDLVYQYLRVARESQPKFFLMENVPGFVSFNDNEYLKSFLAEAYFAGYELVYGLVNAVEYGVPQDRCRFICAGTRRDLFACDGILASLPRPECFAQSDLDKISQAKKLLFPEATADALEILACAPGVRYFPDRPVLVPPAPVRDGSRAEGFLDFYRKLRAEEPDRLVWGPKEAAA